MMRTYLQTLSIAVLALFFLVSCGDDKPTPAQASAPAPTTTNPNDVVVSQFRCNRDKLKTPYCSDTRINATRGQMPVELKAFSDGCASLNGTVPNGPCPSGYVGGCQSPQSKNGETTYNTIFWIYNSTTTAVKQLCTDNNMSYVNP